MSKNAYYHENTPFMSVTPYAVEAMSLYDIFTGVPLFKDIVLSVWKFLENDVPVLRADSEVLAMAYSPLREKSVVINGNSYIMFTYAMIYRYSTVFGIPVDREAMLEKITRIYRFIENNRTPNGLWWYYADMELEKGNFIDCFHTCFVIKNIAKTAIILGDEQMYSTARRAFYALPSHFKDPRTSLYRRFTTGRRVNTLVKYDLYDNAEVISLSILMGERALAEELISAVFAHFSDKKGVHLYSQIWKLGVKRYRVYLRWATMPMVYALTLYLLALEKDVKFLMKLYGSYPPG